jgi:hypothetical protein
MLFIEVVDNMVVDMLVVDIDLLVEVDNMVGQVLVYMLLVGHMLPVVGAELHRHR